MTLLLWRPARERIGNNDSGDDNGGDASLAGCLVQLPRPTDDAPKLVSAILFAPLGLNRQKRARRFLQPILGHGPDETTPVRA
jgi:hypothetical protein